MVRAFEWNSTLIYFFGLEIDAAISKVLRTISEADFHRHQNKHEEAITALVQYILAKKMIRFERSCRSRRLSEFLTDYPEQLEI
jgi:hypothetical protein